MFHVKHWSRLEHYQALLKKWTRKINLVSPETVAEAEMRHFRDSAQLFQHVRNAPARWVDLGSGGGFPGLVIAILAAGDSWETKFTLIESDQRKAAFLRTVSRETSVPVEVVSKRIEEVPPCVAEVVSARALAPLPRLVPWIRRHLHPEGKAFLPKGRNYQQELLEVWDSFEFSLVVHPSETNPEAVILEIGDIRDV